MKKNPILILVATSLAIFSAYFIYNNRSGTMSDELRDFAFKDTASITRVFLADKAGKKITLDRKSNYEWTVNESYWARPDAIKLLLETIHDVEVWSPVGKNAYNNIIKSIAAKGVKVELYTAQGKVKTYYVGGPTPDQMGTYMYMENSTVPFITNIAGFDGYLTPRYITERADWAVKNVFRLGEGELLSLSVADRERAGFAFKIERDQTTGDCMLFDGFEKPVSNISQDKVTDYLQKYRVLNFEGLEKSLLPNQRDSLRAQTPFRSIVMIKTNGDTSRIDLWRRPITTQTVNLSMEDGTPYPYDIDRMTATLNKDTSLVIVQYFSFERLFLKPSDFQSLNNSK
ncbi:MAG: DUF4340 domain-containing protein [Bacteroidota bacterium]|jgi:hypothetical protein